MSTNAASTTFEGAYWIRNKSDGSVLGIGAVSGGLVSLASQDRLATRQTLADYSQMWLVEPLSDGISFRIRNAQSSNVLDVKESGTADGTPVIIYTQTDNPNQHWTFNWVDDANGVAYYRISNVYTKKALTLTSGSGAVAVSSSWNDGQQQRWELKPVVLPPVYRIAHAQTGWYLHYATANGPAIVDNKLSSVDNSRSQLWVLETIPDSDAYVIRSLENNSMVLDLSGSSTADGTPVFTYSYHGGRNQQWRIDENSPDDNRVKIVSVVAGTVAQVVEGPTSGTVQAQTDHGDILQTWRLEQCPALSVYWTTIQNLQTGTFLKQDGSTVSPSLGMAHKLDYSVQWRFVPDQTLPHHYQVVNRATGWVILARSQAPTVTAGERNREEQGALWATEPVEDGVGIISTLTSGALDHYGGDTIQANPNIGPGNPWRHWVAVQVSDRLPSFALVNSRTGHSLDFRSATVQGGVVMSTDSTSDWSNQWYLDILAGDTPGSLIYAIISKVSGMVLDHWDGRRIEAYNDNTTDPYHQWKLIPCPCGENYFQIQNVATSRYLEELIDGVPNANATQPMNPDSPSNGDMAQCWELVSSRIEQFDLFTVDDDVLQRTLPHFQPNDSETLEHRIVKRSPGREKKGKDKTAHKPQNPRLLRDVHPFIVEIFELLINEWVEDQLPSTVQAGTRVSTDRREVERRWEMRIPQALLLGSDRAGWMRIDIQGTYETSPGVRVANIQGQWNNESVFHVIVPVAVNVGRETIREAMRQSLQQHTSITIAAANSRPPAGGKKPNTTPRPPPGPGGSGNGWIYLAAAIIPIVLLSPLGL